MILVGNQRGGARDLALHLMKHENEQVVVHELRGFASDTLMDAFRESYALSRATRCKQHLFSLSLNPPREAEVTPEAFEDAVSRAEVQLGLTGQPRAIVFHEKKGLDGRTRRHAHAVWCRIDADKQRAVQLSFSKRKLQSLARDLYLENDWQMPRGFVRASEADPRNYTLAEWQQAKRAERDPDTMKAMFQDCWAISDSQGAFAYALEERGLILARGDRRGVVAVDRDGEVYAISRWVGIKAAQVRKKIAAPERLPDVAEAHGEAAGIVVDRLKELEAEQRQTGAHTLARAIKAAQRQREQQRLEQDRVASMQERRADDEARRRSVRIRTGWRGLIDFITGKRRRMADLNRLEELKAQRRDREERRDLLDRHHLQLDNAEGRIARERSRMADILAELRADIERLTPWPFPDKEPERGKPRRARRATKERPRRKRSRDGP